MFTLLYNRILEPSHLIKLEPKMHLKTTRTSHCQQTPSANHQSTAFINLTTLDILIFLPSLLPF